MDKKDDATGLQAILDGMFEKWDRGPQQREQLRIREVWQEVVGPQIAGRTRPETLRNAVLVVSVASSVWIQELSFLKQEILDRISRRLAPGTIREIRFKLGDIQQAGVEHLPELSQDEQELIARQTASIEDSELRESLQNLFIASRRQKKKREAF